jgi:hypothetical protein
VGAEIILHGEITEFTEGTDFILHREIREFTEGTEIIIHREIRESKEELRERLRCRSRGPTI